MHKRVFILMLGALLIFPLTVRSADSCGITKRTLDNGFDVIVIHNPAVPLVIMDNIRKVTTGDVQEVCNEYMHNLQFVLIGSPASLQLSPFMYSEARNSRSLP